MNHIAVGIAWLSGACLIAFGVQGCADGHNVFGWAILGGFFALCAQSSTRRPS